MTPAPQRRYVVFVSYLLAGLESGILGGLAALGWFAVNSLWLGQSVWAAPYWLGATLGVAAPAPRGYPLVSLAGMAFHLSMAGGLGMCFGLAAREARRFLRVVLLALSMGLTAYYLNMHFLDRQRELAAVVSPARRSLLVAHLLFGAFLTRYPRLLRSVRDSL